jgi:signal transduction histidine kinase
MPLHLAPSGWLTLFACAGELGLVLLALLRGSRSPLALPLVLLSLDLFFWNFAALGYDISAHRSWHWLDVATSPLSAPLALYFVLTFVGRRRQLRWVLILAWVAFGLLSAASALAFFFPWAQDFAGSPTWAVLHLVGLLPVVAIGVVCLLLHLRRTSSREERVRTELLLAGFAVLAALGSSELLGGMGLPFPSLGNLGVLALNAAMAIVALRFRLLERQLTLSVLWNVAALAVLVIAAYGATFHFQGTPAAMVVLGTATLGFAVLAAALQVRSAVAVRRARLQALALLGRFSAQMAHDLKNPLAALKGAAQYLKEELRQGRTLVNQSEFVNLMLEQIERLQKAIGDYQRLARVEPLLAPLQVNDLVREVLALQHFASDGKVSVEARLEERLPPCLADRQLLAEALENLVQNAFEAMSGGGKLTVRTGWNGQDGHLTIAVEDNGTGMDARTRERAFDDFFTTKPTGTGLGLAFARKVAEAHGGSILLTSREGRGTVAQLDLPLNPSVDES